MNQILLIFVAIICAIQALQVIALARPTSNRNRQKLRPLAQRTSGGKSPLDVELDLWQSGYIHIIGSDDSGQGCIAGPIVTASLSISRTNEMPPIIPGVADSKLLSADDRDRIYQQICDDPSTYSWTYATRSNAEIDKAGLDKATMSCFSESILSLAEKVTGKSFADEDATEAKDSQLYSIVDGKRSPAKLPIQSRPWVKGDVTVYTVALASILARVVRDKLMEEAAKEYTEYGFELHGGYPTKEHILALHTNGISPIHRRSTRPVQSRVNVSRDQFLSILGLTSLSSLIVAPEDSTATYVDQKKGIVLPDKGEIESAVPSDWEDVENPFLERGTGSILTRLDSSDDAIFYSDPRFVEHVDTQAVSLMTDYISNVAINAQTSDVLDLCSSWTSHIAEEPRSSLKKVAGLGMNKQELEANKALSEWTVQDLNTKPKLPYEDQSFDVVLCQLSIDYLTQPLEVCREIARVLRKGGTVHILFSNRLFLSKAVALWTGADDIDHAYTVACYLHFCKGGLTDIMARDLSIRQRRGQHVIGDPLYVITASKR